MQADFAEYMSAFPPPPPFKDRFYLWQFITKGGVECLGLFVRRGSRLYLEEVWCIFLWFLCLYFLCLYLFSVSVLDSQTLICFVSYDSY